MTGSVKAGMQDQSARVAFCSLITISTGEVWKGKSTHAVRAAHPSPRFLGGQVTRYVGDGGERGGVVGGVGGGELWAAVHGVCGLAGYHSGVYGIVCLGGNKGRGR